jgi:uroporphyrinogen decarboxylase
MFAWGTKGEIEASVKECVDVAAGGSGYILASGCEIPLNSTIENIRHFMAVADQYGRYGDPNT